MRIGSSGGSRKNMDLQQLLQLLAPPLGVGAEGPLFYLALLLLGLGVGVLTGFFGVGGGFLVVPLLNVVLGINYEVAVGSSLSFIIGTSFSGVLKQRQEGNVHFRVAGYLVSGSVLGAVLGDSLQNYLLFRVAGGQEAVFTPIMHSIFIVLLIATMWSMKPPSKKNRAPAHSTEKVPFLAKIGVPPYFHTPETEGWSESRGFSVPGTFLAGIGIGIATGLLGIGGGVLLVPVLLGLFGLSHQRTAGTSLAVIFSTAVVGILKKGLAEIPKISLPLTMVLLVSSVIGVQFGILLVRHAGAHDFRRYFNYVLLLSITLIVADLVRSLF